MALQHQVSTFLIAAPRVPTLVSTEPEQSFCRAGNVITMAFKQKQETVEAFLLFFIYRYAQLHPASAQRKFTSVKASMQP